MRKIKIGLVNLNPTVGDFTGNTEQLIAKALEPARHGAHLVITSVGAISGHPCLDLVRWPHFVEQQWQQLERFAEQTARVAPQTVFIVNLHIWRDGQAVEVSATVINGDIVGLVPALSTDPNSRYELGFSSSHCSVPIGDLLYFTEFGTFGALTGQNYEHAPHLAYNGAEILVFQNALDFQPSAGHERMQMAASLSATTKSVIVWANQYGGNDGLMFDGSSYVFANGQLLHYSEYQRQGWTMVDVDLDQISTNRRQAGLWNDNQSAHIRHNPTTDINIGGRQASTASLPPSMPMPDPFFETRDQFHQRMIEASVTGLVDYVRKNPHFQGILISTSGGKDSLYSTIIAYLAAQRLFADLPEAERTKRVHQFVVCLSQPSRHTGGDSKSIAYETADTLDLTFIEQSIEEEYANDVEQTKWLSGLSTLPEITDQNIQARIRAKRAWNLANARHLLFLYTGNLSEGMVGYCTRGGDDQGGYGLIKGILKTTEIELLELLYKIHGWGFIEHALAVVPSAELADGQTDEDDLMPYPVLDFCIRKFMVEKLSPAELYLALRKKWTDQQLLNLDPNYEPGKLKVWVKRFLTKRFTTIFKGVTSPLGQDFHTIGHEQIPVITSLNWLDLDAIDQLPD